MRDPRPLVALTMGDVAGVGPEVIARAWADGPLRALARPFVVGDSGTLRRAVDLLGTGATVQAIGGPEEAEPGPGVIPCLDASSCDLSGVRPGVVDARGRPGFERLPGRGDRPGDGRAGRRDRDPAAPEGVAPRGGRATPRPYRDPRRAVPGPRARDDALPRTPRGLDPARPGGGPRHAPRRAPAGLRPAHGRRRRGQDPPGRRRPPPAHGGATSAGGRRRVEPARGRERPVRRRGADDHRPGRRRLRRPRGSTRPARSPPTPSSPAPWPASSTPWSPCTTTRGTSRSRPSASTGP